MKAAVRVERNKYDVTRDVRRMLTSAQLVEAIIKEVRGKSAGKKTETNILGMVPARAATYMRYKAGAKTAQVWNQDGKEERIDLPLEDGWRTSDGNPFGVPNGPEATRDNPGALYLLRRQDKAFSGPVGLGNCWSDDRSWRDFDAYGDWFDSPGVALIAAQLQLPGEGNGTLIVKGTPEQLEAAIRLLRTKQ